MYFKTRALLPAAILFAASTQALAGIPVLNTDTLATGEWMFSTYYATDKTSSGVFLDLVSSSFVGTTESQGSDTGISISHGIDDRLQFSLSGGLLRQEGSDDLYGPTHWTLSSRDSGLRDLTGSLGLRLAESGPWSWLGGISVTAPTASDTSSTPTQYVNGVLTASGTDGAAGSGHTSTGLGISGSRHNENSALELNASISASDGDSSRYRKRMSAAWVFLPNKDTDISIGISTSHVESTNNNGTALTESFWTRSAHVAAGYMVSESLRVAASWSHREADGATTRYPASGNSWTSDGFQGDYAWVNLQLLLH